MTDIGVEETIYPGACSDKQEGQREGPPQSEELTRELPDLVQHFRL